MKDFRVTVLVLACLLVASSAGDGGRNVTAERKPETSRANDLKRTLAKAFSAYEQIKEYKCTHYRRQRVNGKMTRMQKSLLKFRKPFSVYFEVLEGRQPGMEVLYVEGQNSGNIRVRPGGPMGFFTVNLDPTSDRAMQGELYPITKIGIKNILDIAAGLVKKLDDSGSLQWSIRDSSSHGIKTLRFELTAPKSPQGSYFCYRAVMHIDPRTALPVHVLVYDRDDRLREEYLYLNIDTEPEFKDGEFSFDAL